MAGNDANTLLLLHMDGADASTTFTDSSASARTITRVGNAQIDTAQSKFGGASGLFDGTGDYLTVPDSADWAFGSGNFTIDFWIRVAASTNAARIAGHQTTDSNTGWRMGARTDNGNWYFDLYSGGSLIVNVTTASPLSANTWTHMAFVKNGTDYRFYKDGTSVGSSTDANVVGDYTGTFRIGSDIDAAAFLNGWLDEFRISNIARWTTTFTPPTEAYSAAIAIPVLTRQYRERWS
ncbi:MAG: LamG domain-containing protein [Gemmatimonadaceae bacterium]|nr:LamG domain-containing protein [Gemmatimonadaceae bacterium]